MKSSEFIKYITQHNEYHTPLDKKLCFLKRLHLPIRLCFYPRIGQIILAGSRVARRQEYDQAFWIEQSRQVFEAVESYGGIFHITGLEQIRQTKGPVVFISNHMSTLETFVLPCLILPFKEITFVIKESLLKYPFFGHLMKSRQPISVTRKDPREDLKTVLQEGTKILGNGRSLVIFPQSTRYLSLEPEHFNTLGVKLAKRAGVPVIPLALKTDFWKRGKFLKELGPIGQPQDIYFKFGQSMTIQGNGKEEHRKIISFIQDFLERIKDNRL